MAILLTGVGYIGATLLRRLAERDTSGNERIVALENFFSTLRADVEAVLPSGARLVDGDVAQPDAVARAFDVLERRESEALTVFHLAAQPSAAIAACDPDTTERTNLVGARVVLDAARARGARVVFGGSFRVYGDDLLGQTVDEQTPYGRVGDLSHLSKVYVEQLARMVRVPFASVRLGVTYGLSPIMKTSPAFMTVPNLFCKCAAQGEVLRVLEDRPIALIHVEDAADALLAAADRLEPPPSGTEPSYEIVNAAPEVATIGQLARTVQRLAATRGVRVLIEGEAASEAGFQVRSRLGDRANVKHTLAHNLGDVLDFFLKTR